MKYFATPTSVGVYETFLTMAAIYFVFMMAGALAYRVPASGWKPAGWTPPVSQTANAMITQRHVHVSKVWGIPQFWLLWGVLFLNVTAGIGILGMSSPLIQEVFGGQLLGLPAGTTFNSLTPAQLSQTAAIAAGFTGLLSLFNIGGRFFWASCSDFLGRKNTYFVFLGLGLLLYAAIPSMAHGGHLGLFVAFFCIILSMYGGGFATIPAYLADLFGTQMVGAIHGRILTAWSMAGIFGPLLVTGFREYQLANGVPKAQVYDITMYVLAGLVLIGLLCNLMVRPIADRHFMTDAELAAERQSAQDRIVSGGGRIDSAAGGTGTTSSVVVAFAWAAVGIPLAFGIWTTLQKAVLLFQ
jgi:MFS family permease